MRSDPAGDALEGDAGFQSKKGLSLEVQWAFWEAFKAITPETGGIPFSRFRESVDWAFGAGCWDALAGAEPAKSQKPASRRLAFLSGAEKHLHPRGWGGFLTDITIAKASLLRRPETRDRDLEILSGRLLWDLSKVPLADLLARAETAGVGLKEEMKRLSKAGLLLASGEGDTPQTIRLRGKWVVDKKGEKVLVRPDQLTVLQQLRWFPAAARAAAKAIWEDEPWPVQRTENDPLMIMVAFEDSIPFKDVCRTPLDDLIFQEDLKTALDVLGRLQLTEAEEYMFLTVLETGSWLEAGQVLGLKPATARKRKERLLKKLRPPWKELSPP